jgi:hypothetical protein
VSNAWFCVKQILSRCFVSFTETRLDASAQVAEMVNQVH